MPEPPLSDAELIDVRVILARQQLTLNGTGGASTETLRVNHNAANTGFSVNQAGNATAMLVQTNAGINQPCIQLHARGNSAALQITQDDGEDAIDVGAADIRCRQIIATLHSVLANTGGMQWAESSDPLHYYTGLTLDAQNRMVVGNVTRGWPMRFEIANDKTIEFVVGGTTIMRVSSAGVEALVPASTPVQGEGI
jgi:hypothetical protein